MRSRELRAPGAFARTATSMAGVALVVAACARDPEVVRSYDSRCKELGNLTVSSQDEREAISRMQRDVVDLGGDTLLFGEDAVLQLQIASSRRAAEAAGEANRQAIERGEPLPRSAEIVDWVSTAVRAPEGESWFYGAALECGK